MVLQCRCDFCVAREKSVEAISENIARAASKVTSRKETFSELLGKAGSVGTGPITDKIEQAILALK
jgi:hypothetical protein